MIIALEPSSLEMPAFNAPQNILRWGARSRLRSMLCAILVASSAAGLPALRDLSVRERASGELKRPAGGPQKGLSAVAPGGNGTSQGVKPSGTELKFRDRIEIPVEWSSVDRSRTQDGGRSE